MMKKTLLTFIFILLIFSGIMVTANADSWLWPIPTSVSNYKTLSRGYWYNSSSDYHSGVDIAVPTGSKVMASKDGTVWKAYKGCGNYSCSYGTCSSSTCSGNALSNKSSSGYCGESYGNSVFVKHNDGTISIYGHLSEVSVSTGDIVTQGQLLGKTGSSGHSTGPHLHFTITTKTSGYSKNSINNNPLNSGFSIGNNKTDMDNATITYIMQESIGLTDTEAPTIEYTGTTNVSSSSFTVNFKLNDNIGVNRVWLVVYGPGATKEFGKSASNGKFSYTINTADYGGSGTYSVHIYAYDDAENRGEGRSGTIHLVKPNPPTNVTSEKNVYKPGEQINFTWSNVESATDYLITIWNGSTQMYSAYLGNKTSFSTPLAYTGNYAICVSAGNSVGYSEFTNYNFVVTDSIPQSPTTVTSEKNVYKPDEQIIFTWNKAKNATDYLITIWNGSNQIYSKYLGNKTSFSTTLAYTGNYAICVSAGNSVGYSEFTNYNFVVTDSIPQSPTTVTSEKNVYKPDEQITFTWNKAKNATDYLITIWNGSNQIYSSYLGDTTSFSTPLTYTGNYAICVSAGNSVGYSEFTNYNFIVTNELITQSNIEYKNKTYYIKTKIYNITDSCNIIIAGYNSSNKLMDIKVIPYENQEIVTSSLAGDIDKIKVMVWDSLQSGKPLCEAEVIEKNEFIEE